MIRLNDTQGETLLIALEGLPDFRNLCLDIQGQLANPGGPTDLIQSIQAVVGMPGARNVLSGDALSKLRGLLLTPREFNAVTNIEEFKGIACLGCGQRMHEMEIGTVRSTGIYCVLCQNPATVRCKGCKNPVPLIHTFFTILRRMVKGGCQICKDKEKGIEPQQGRAEELRTPNLANELRRVARGFGRAPEPMIPTARWDGIPAQPTTAGPQEGTGQWHNPTFTGNLDNLVAPPPELLDTDDYLDGDDV